MRLSIFNVDDLRTLLLDLDGTLIDSEKAFFLSFKEVLKQGYNIDITPEDYKKYELEQNKMLINKLKEKGMLSLNVREQEIMNGVYDNYLVPFKKVICEEESVDNFNVLKELKQVGLDLGLVTTCKRRFLDVLISELKLQNLFDLIIAREDVKQLKPSSEAYITALNFFNAAASNCLAIEDSKRGVDAALTAGITTIKVENFTTIKYSYPKAIECDSANKVLKRILTNANK